jgi:preprotein translocase subunit SecG
VKTSFTQTVQCALTSSKTIGVLQVTIDSSNLTQTPVTPAAATHNLHLQGSIGTTTTAAAVLDVRYVVTFQFPVPQNMSRISNRMRVYYEAMTGGLTASVLSSEFMYIFREYLLQNEGNRAADGGSPLSWVFQMAPQYTSPVLLQPASPTSSPVSSATSSASGAAASPSALLSVVVAVVAVLMGVVVLCIVYAVYSIYTQYKLQQAKDAQKWFQQQQQQLIDRNILFHTNMTYLDDGTNV